MHNPRSSMTKLFLVFKKIALLLICTLIFSAVLLCIPPKTAHAEPICEEISETTIIPKNGLNFSNGKDKFASNYDVFQTVEATSDCLSLASEVTGYADANGFDSPHFWSKDTWRSNLISFIGASDYVDQGVTFEFGNKKWEKGDTLEAEFIYPCVGTYQDNPIGAKLCLTATYNPWLRQRYALTSGVDLSNEHSGQPETPFDYPVVQLCNLFYAGGYFANLENIKIDLYFFDIEDKSIIDIKDCFLSFTSQNCYLYDDQTGQKHDCDELTCPSETLLLPVEHTKKIQIHTNGNMDYCIKEINGASYIYTYPSSNDFEDRLGSQDFCHNTTTFYQDDYFSIELNRPLNASGWFSLSSSTTGFVPNDNPTKYASTNFVNRGDAVQFSIRQPVHTLGSNLLREYDSFCICDTLDKNLTYKSAEIYYINPQTSKRTQLGTSAGNIHFDSKTNTVSFVFAKDFLTTKNNENNDPRKSLIYQGGTYEMKISAKVSDNADKQITNIGYTTINNYSAETNEVAIDINLPSLTITKESPDEVKVGDEIEYKIHIENVQPNSIAQGVRIRDKNLYMAQNYIEDSLTIEGVPESVFLSPTSSDAVTNSYSETITPEEGLEVDIKYLPSGFPITITFKVLATEEANGKNHILHNTCIASAKNANNTEASSDTLVNSANLLIAKRINNFESRTDDIVTYTISVINNEPGTIARNTLIADSIPEGIELLPESLRILTGDEIYNFAPTEQDYQNQEDTLNNTNKDLNTSDGKNEQADANHTESNETTQQVLVEQTNENQDEPESSDIKEQTPEISEIINNEDDADAVEDDAGAAEDDSTEADFLEKDDSDSEQIDHEESNDQQIAIEKMFGDVSCTISGKDIEICIPEIAANELVIITYDARTSKQGNGAIQQNNASATADNLITNEAVTACALEWTNDGVLAFNKDVARDVVDINERTTYTIYVENIIPNTVVRNLVITDLDTQDALNIDQETIRVNGFPQEVTHPVFEDGELYNETFHNTYDVSKDENKFTVMIDYLPYGAPIEILYEASPKNGTEGTSLLNVAQALGENILDDCVYEDEALITVPEEERETQEQIIKKKEKPIVEASNKLWDKTGNNPFAVGLSLLVTVVCCLIVFRYLRSN